MKALKKNSWFKVMGMALSAIFLVVTSGCGAMFTGIKQDISLNSDPSGVTAVVKSRGKEKMRVTTPTTVTLKKSGKYSIDFQKEGYVPQTLQISKHVQGGMVALDFIWLLGAIVPAALTLTLDGVTGGWYKLSPETVNISLKPEGHSKAEVPAPAEEPRKN